MTKLGRLQKNCQLAHRVSDLLVEIHATITWHGSGDRPEGLIAHHCVRHAALMHFPCPPPGPPVGP